MIKLTVLLTIMLVIVSCSVAQPGKYGTADKKAVKLYEEARMCFNDVDHTTGKRNTACSKEALLKALERDKNFAEARSLLSQVYIEERDFENALIEKEKLISNPVTATKVSSSEFYYLAKLAITVGDYNKTLKYATKYYNIQNNNPALANECRKWMLDAEFALDAIKNPVPFNPINVGPGINTNRNEYFPTITADDKTILFTRDVEDARVEYYHSQEDMFVSKRQSSALEWHHSNPVSKNINTVNNEGAPTYSADGKYIIMVVCEKGPERSYGKDRIGYGSCDLFFSERVGDTWGKPVNIGPPINTSSWETQPSYSSDGKTLYFVRGIYKQGSRNKEQDIWKAEIGPDGRWTKPERLGPNVNTPGKEESVQIHPDGQTLYFSSDGHPGMGGTDIYVSRLQPDGKWGKATNLGYPINTHKEENSLLVSSKGDVAYFSSDREGGYGGLDIYSFELPEEVRPVLTTYVKGKVYDAKTKAPLAADLQLFDLKTNDLFKRTFANRGNGDFMVPMPKNKEFGLIAEYPGYVNFSEHYSVDDLKETEEGFVLEIPLNKIEEGETFVLENVFFDVAKWDLKPESLAELEKLKSFLVKNQNLKIELGGHTDSDGDDSANQLLSQRRANAVMEWLIKNGIEDSRLSAKGYGETQPRQPNDTPENKAKNRRTVVTVL